MKRPVLIYSILFLTVLWSDLSAQNAFFKQWPKGSSPKEVGRKVTGHFIKTPYANFNRSKPADEIIYSEVCTWYGALQFSKESRAKKLVKELEDRFIPLMGEKKKLMPKPDHVDHTVFGSIPLELYIQTGQEKYLKLGKYFADKQWELPANAKPEYQRLLDKGLSWQTRLWIDDMFMISLVQVQAYRATGDRKYIDRAAKEMVVYLDSIQKPNGLFYHAPDVPFFWGRGNGWMAAGMTELLRSLPEDNADRERILQGYRTMMESLRNFQGEDGMWRQLVDDPSAWPETSCTGMFSYAFISGVKKGWLDEKTFGPAARKGWLALVKYIDENGDVRDVCEGTNKKNDRQYYLDRKRITGDMHGQAPVLWCAFALLN